MTVPISLVGELFPVGVVHPVALVADGANYYPTGTLFLEGEVTNITVGADNPQGTITPFGTLTYVSDASPRTFEGTITPTGELTSTTVIDAGCFTEADYTCVDASTPDYTCIGACETQQEIINPEILLSGVIIPIGSMTTLSNILQLLGGVITPAGALSSLKTGFPIEGLMIWLKADAGVTQTGDRMTPDSKWIDQVSPEQSPTVYPRTGTAQPRIVPNAINGLPAVRFGENSSNINWVEWDDDSRFEAPWVGESHMFFVIKMTNGPSATSSSGWLKLGCVGPGSIGFNHYPFGDSVCYCDYNSTSRKQWAWPGSITQTWHVAEFQSKNGLWKHLINGDEIFATAVNTFCVPQFGHLGMTTASIRGDYWALEYMEYSRVLSADEAEETRQYLYDRLGI